MSFTFAEYALGNRLRSLETFKRAATRENVIAFTLGLCEEAGEVAGKVRALEGITHRKAGMSEIEVAKEIGDVIAYLDLVAQGYGFTLEYCAQMKYNIVSERSGSSYYFKDGKLLQRFATVDTTEEDKLKDTIASLGMGPDDFPGSDYP